MRLISREYFRVKLAICLHDGSQIREVIDDSDKIETILRNKFSVKILIPYDS